MSTNHRWNISKSAIWVAELRTNPETVIMARSRAKLDKLIADYERTHACSFTAFCQSFNQQSQASF